MTEHAHDPHANHEGHGHDHAHHGKLSHYLAVFVALCLLTGASFFTYSDAWPFKEDKHVTWAFMMAVSCTKAMLVIMFFMHLLWEANWKWVLTVPASCMSIFLLLMLVPDVGMRQDNGFAWYSNQRLKFTALPPAVEKAEEREADEAAADHAHPVGASPTH